MEGLEVRDIRGILWCIHGMVSSRCSGGRSSFCVAPFPLRDNRVGVRAIPQ